MKELVKSPVRFDEDTHTYWLGEQQLQGITSTLIHRAFPDKYKDVDKEVLANAAAKGKELHSLIEYHDNFKTDIDEHTDPRVASYERLKSEYGLTTIANEYLVSDEKNYASCIDLVFVDKDGEICLGDIKSTYTLDRQSTSLQLSIYKRMFEQQNPGLTVRHIYVIWLPNRDHTLAEIQYLPVVGDEIIDSLIEADLTDKPFDIAETYGTLPARLSDVEDEIIRIEEQMKVIKPRYEELRKGLYDLMTKHNVKQFRGSKVLLTRVLPMTCETFDSKKFQQDHPQLYEEYIKKTTRNGSLKITITKDETQ